MLNIRKIAAEHYYVLTALLMFLSFPNFDYAFFRCCALCAWVFLVPLLLGVRSKEMKDVMFTSFITGLLGNYFTYGWIGNFGAKEPGGYFVIVFFLIPSLSAFFALKMIAAEFFSRRFPVLRVLIYPSVWIIVDFIQATGFLAFPWPYVGYSQYAFKSFIQAASVTGILGINFIIILFNAVVADFIAGAPGTVNLRHALRSRRGLSLLSAIILVAVIAAAGRYRLATHGQEPAGTGLRVAVIQTCISPWDNWNRKKFRNLEELIRHTDGALVENPDFIIWSESATLEEISFRARFGEPDAFDSALTGYVSRIGKPLLTGEIGRYPVREERFIRFYPQNNAVLIAADGSVVKTYPKINLVPFGEWFPYEKWFPFVKRIASHFGGSDFVPGKRPELFTVNGMDFGALICYEGIFYRLCREYTNMGASFLVNITNDGWTDSYGGHYQHFSAAVFRAVENGLWVIRAGNDGVSAVIDPEGRVTSTMPYLEKGHMSGTVYPARNTRTIYSKSGDLILYVAIIFILLLSVSYIYKYITVRRSAGVTDCSFNDGAREVDG